jgi:Tol biopolymer transport system component
MLSISKVLSLFTVIIITDFFMCDITLAQRTKEIAKMVEAESEQNRLSNSLTMHQISSDFSFYAIYDRLLDTESHNLHIMHSAMSSDGNKLIFSGTDLVTANPLVYMLDADGQNLISIPIPSDVGVINNVKINNDGSRAFFNNYHLIYKVEGGTAIKILDTEDYSEVDRCWGGIQITADGEWVYFREYADDLWRVGQDGSSPERIIDDASVRHDGNTGFQVYEFDISADGNTIVFGLNGYWDNGILRWKHELFAFNGGNYQQLTSDDGNLLKSNPTISGDGSTIVFCHWGDNKWYSIKPDGSDKIELGDRGLNIAGADLTHDGTKMLYNDALANAGRLVNTDGSGCLDLFPWRIGPNPTDNLYISHDGRRVSFTTRYGIPAAEALYVGYFNEPSIVTDAPIIHSIEINPQTMPVNDPNAIVTLTSQISDLQGLSDLNDCTVDELLDGRLVEKKSTNLPVYFNFDPNDDGNIPDQTADDGLYTSEGEPGDRINEFSSMVVRIGASDFSNNVAVADVILSIGPTGIRDKKSDYKRQGFTLCQNHPNPFNPRTIINYELPITNYVELSIFNLLGQKVATLVNKKQNAGAYQVEWDAGQLSSGVYYYVIKAGTWREAKRMIFLQ